MPFAFSRTGDFPYTTLFRSGHLRRRLQFPCITAIPGPEDADRQPSAGTAAELPRSGVQHELVPRCRSEEHTSELQSRSELVCRLLLEKKKTIKKHTTPYINN